MPRRHTSSVPHRRPSGRRVRLVVPLGGAAALVLACSSVLVAQPRSGSAATTYRISSAPGGADGDGRSFFPAITPNGRFVAFSSSSTDLLATATLPAGNVYVRDLRTGSLTLVSVGSGGAAAAGSSDHPSISANGRFVAFDSTATNLVPGDTEGHTDVFVTDLATGTTVRVSVGAAGGGDGDSQFPSISAGGRYVAFQSYASDLVAGDSNGRDDVFVRDLVAGTTVRVSVDASGADANGDSAEPAISGTGRFVAFESEATDLVAGGADTSPNPDVYVRDLVAGTTRWVSAPAGGGANGGDSDDPTISSDGTKVAFESTATDLVAGDTNGVKDVFLVDVSTGTVLRVSVAQDGTQADDESGTPAVSSTGAFVAFSSYATNLAGGDGNGVGDVYLRNVPAGTTTRVSVDTTGGDPDGDSRQPSVDANGGLVAFTSAADDLVANDVNSFTDDFVRRMG